MLGRTRLTLRRSRQTANGILGSIGFLDTSAKADDATRVTSDWVRDES
jgi:hypothetical protein